MDKLSQTGCGWKEGPGKEKWVFYHDVFSLPQAFIVFGVHHLSLRWSVVRTSLSFLQPLYYRTTAVKITVSLVPLCPLSLHVHFHIFTFWISVCPQSTIKSSECISISVSISIVSVSYQYQVSRIR
jgi:hypothetical protein